MKYLHSVEMVLCKRMKNYGMICLLLLTCYPAIVMGMSNSPADTKPIILSDSTHVNPDSLKQKFLKVYKTYRTQKQNELYKLNWLNNNYNYMFDMYDSELSDSELYDVSKEVYLDYYLRKVELYNYNNIVYFYLDMKHAQSRKGAIQFRIPLPNFTNLFEDKKTLED